MEYPNEPEKKNRESSIRWQGRTIEQFGYASNLVLGLAIAAIGYESNLFLSRELEISVWQNCLLTVSLLALVLSAGAALWCVITRLRNFRLTAEIARQREDNATALELQPLRTKSNELGNFTWTLFWWQIWAFAVGILSLVVVVGGEVGAVV